MANLHFRATAASMLAVATAMVAVPSPSSVLEAMQSANDYFMTHNPTGNCDWERGTYYDGATAYYNVSKDSKALSFIETWAISNNWTCSNGEHTPAYDYDANKQCSGHSYARLYNLAPADYKLAMAVTLERQAATYAGACTNLQLQHVPLSVRQSTL